jgi:hypothetical protein
MWLEYLPRKYKARSSNPHIAKKKKFKLPFKGKGFLYSVRKYVCIIITK